MTARLLLMYISSSQHVRTNTAEVSEKEQLKLAEEENDGKEDEITINGKAGIIGNEDDTGFVDKGAFGGDKDEKTMIMMKMTTMMTSNPQWMMKISKLSSMLTSNTMIPRKLMLL